MLLSAIPEGTQYQKYLRYANNEIDLIDLGVFNGSLATNNIDFITKRYEHITQENFIQILQDFKPDVIHFTGHGGKEGIIFEDGTPLTKQQLNEAFGYGNEFQLIFFNACYSENQLKYLADFKNIKCMIGIELEIEEMLASDFAVRFYTEFKNQFLRSKIDGNQNTFEIIPTVYFNTVRKFQFDYNKKVVLQKFHPESEYRKILAKLNSFKDEHSPFENAILEYKIKVIQYKGIPDELHSKIKGIVQRYDESDRTVNDIDNLKGELESIFSILIDLLVYGIEYGIDEQRELMIEMKNKINTSLKSTVELIDNSQINIYQTLYEEVILKVFKKIYFDIEIDSIKNIDPVVPEDPGYELFGDVIEIMHSIFNSMFLLRGTINLSFILDKQIFIQYLISKCSNYLHYVDLDYRELVHLSRESFGIDIDEITRDDRFKISPYISNLNSELQRDQLEEDRGVRYLNLKQNLETFFEIEGKITRLFQIIMIKGLELKRYASYNENHTSTEHGKKILKEKKIKNRTYVGLLKEITKIERELKENADTKNILTFTFPKISELISKINEIDCIYYGDSYGNFDSIYDIYENLYDTINSLYWSLRSSSIEHPYLFPELAELRDFFRFRLEVLDKKREREIIIQINSLFKERKYTDVILFRTNKYVKDNVKILTKIGLAHYHIGQYQQAITMFDSILKLDKSNPKILFNLGLAYQQYSTMDTKSIEKSIEYFEEAIKEDHRNANSLVSLGLLNFKLHQIKSTQDSKELALNYIEKASNITHNSDWNVLLTKGCILSGFGYYDEAHIYFLKSEELNPNSLIVKLNKIQNLILISYSKNDDTDRNKGFKEITDELNQILETLKNIENRSAKIVILVLLITANLLSTYNYFRNTNAIAELLRLFSLKDSKLVDWDFYSLTKIMDEVSFVKNENKDFIKIILTIPGKKSSNETMSIKQSISNYINKLQSNKIEYLDESDKRIAIKVQTEKKIESKDTVDEKKTKTNYYVWKISVVKNPEFAGNEKIRSVTYEFDPTFKNRFQSFDSNSVSEDFEIKVLGCEGAKVEITITFENNLIWKRVILLQTK